MSFTPNRGQTLNSIPQNMFVWKYIIEGARITLQLKEVFGKLEKSDNYERGLVFNKHCLVTT